MLVLPVVACCCLLLAVVSKIEETGGSVLHGVTPCFMLSTSQFTSQLRKIGFYYYKRLHELWQELKVWHVPVTLWFVKGTNDYV